MVLVRWEPFQEIEGLQQEMNRLFESLAPSWKEESAVSTFAPAAELSETAEEYRLSLEIPGLNPEDFEIHAREDSVSIRGERRSERQSESDGMTRSEFRYGKFQRVIPLPTRIQNDKVSADYQNGILRLTLPKADRDKTRAVKVNIG